jgi:hypothetical protein
MFEADERRPIEQETAMAQDSETATRIAGQAPRLGYVLSQAWHGLIKDLFASYRPERHYMRGPGPKWHEKHTYALGAAAH